MADRQIINKTKKKCGCSSVFSKTKWGYEGFKFICYEHGVGKKRPKPRKGRK